MSDGPHVGRLRSAVSGASPGQLANAIQEWQDGAGLLQVVSTALHTTAPDIKGQMGETGLRAAQAFHEVGKHVGERATTMAAAGNALLSAHAAMTSARSLLQSFDAAPLSAPTQPDLTPGSNHPEDVDKLKAYHSEKASYDAAYADRESKAAAAVQHMDTVYAQSTATMKQVHGQPDPVPTAGGSAGGGSTGGGGAGGSTPTRTSGTGGYTPGSGTRPHDTSTGHTPTSTGPQDPTYTPQHPHGTGPGSTGYDPAHPGGTAQGGTPLGPIGPGSAVPIGGAGPGASPGGLSASTAGGLAGVVGGGALGGLTGISGAVRGPTALPTGGLGGSSDSSGVRPIGSTSRGGASGTLGRGGLVSEETVGAGGSRGAGAAGARGSAAGSTRAGAGSRGASGSRGSGSRGAAGAQGSRNKKDRREKHTDFFLEEQDWVEDEGAAPGVLD